MALPSLTDYQMAFANPSLCLFDGALKTCTIAKTPLGQPRVRSGGFALTYCLEKTSSKWAVRCFHKESPTNDRDRRYQAIANKLHEPEVRNSGYFIDFDFQKQGVMVNGGKYPIVKMAWAKGETLASFLEDNHDDVQAMKNLQVSLRELRNFLFSQHIAHGDIQPGNLMISDRGRKVQLIDYDGMYVPEISALGASEIGLPNYQHPDRIGGASNPWSEKLDYFPFILFDLALSIIIDNPKVWDATQSSDEKVLFEAADFQAPYASTTISKLIKSTNHAHELTAFQAICNAPFEKIPHPDSYASFTPSSSASISKAASKVVQLTYKSAFPVVDGALVSRVAAHLGNVAEVVGRVVEVKKNFTKSGYSRPYYFISFEKWHRGVKMSFRLVIWADTINKFEKKGIDIASRFSGAWVSITGIVDKYESLKTGTVAYQIVVDNAGSLNCITEEEASFRLGRTMRKVVSSTQPALGRNGDTAPSASASSSRSGSNVARLGGLTGKSTAAKPKASPIKTVGTAKTSATPVMTNAQKLKELQGAPRPSSPPKRSPSPNTRITSPSSPTTRTPPPPSGCCVWFVAILGIVVYLVKGIL